MAAQPGLDAPFVFCAPVSGWFVAQRYHQLERKQGAGASAPLSGSAKSSLMSQFRMTLSRRRPRLGFAQDGQDLICS